MFSSFIDEETYCLFYYNGHAVGHSEDIYLGNLFIIEQLTSHGEIRCTVPDGYADPYSDLDENYFFSN